MTSRGPTLKQGIKVLDILADHDRYAIQTLLASGSLSKLLNKPDWQEILARSEKEKAEESLGWIRTFLTGKEIHAVAFTVPRTLPDDDSEFPPYEISVFEGHHGNICQGSVSSLRQGHHRKLLELLPFSIEKALLTSWPEFLLDLGFHRFDRWEVVPHDKDKYGPSSPDCVILVPKGL